MNIQIFLSIIFAIFITTSNVLRLGGKGNMRGIATKFSSLSPKQMKLFKKLLHQRQKRKYGRFA